MPRIRIPSASSPIPSSIGLHSIPFETAPRIFVRSIQGAYNLQAELKRLRAMPRVRKAKEIRFIDGPQAYSRHYVEPKDGITQTFHLHLEEYGPGGRSQKHGHVNEAAFYILDGVGYEVHDGIHCDGRVRLYGPCDPRPGTPVAIALRRGVAIDFALEGLGAIAGRVGDAASGAALAEIDVTVRRDDDFESFTARTGADGRYRIGGLLPGAYRVGTANLGGWVDEVYDDVPCAGFDCSAAAATPVPVAAE